MKDLILKIRAFIAENAKWGSTRNHQNGFDFIEIKDPPLLAIYIENDVITEVAANGEFMEFAKTKAELVSSAIDLLSNHTSGHNLYRTDLEFVKTHWTGSALSLKAALHKMATKMYNHYSKDSQRIVDDYKEHLQSTLDKMAALREAFGLEEDPCTPIHTKKTE